MTAIIVAAVVVGCVGIILGFFLGISGEKFKVEQDPRIDEIKDLLPGSNCGGCGYAGCGAYAKAIVDGDAPTGQCTGCNEESTMAIGDIMGVKAEIGPKMVAFVKCAGDCDTAKNAYEYTGVEDCTAMAFVPGGSAKACSHGCMGFGSCVKVCPFDAIHVVNGVAKVDPLACKACKKCIATCPKNLIELVPYDAAHIVQCSSKDKGKDVMQACSAGCIGCHLCEKNCEKGAITVENNIAHIDQEKCDGCGKCAEKCPKKIIL